MSDYPTYPISPVRDALEALYPNLRSLGVYNRRPISGSSRWSDHSWGAAWDIRPPVGDKYQVVTGSKWTPITRNTLDQVYKTLVAWKKQGRTFGPHKEKLGLILWRVKDHYNHIHVQYEPRYSDKYGVPPQTYEFAAWWAAKNGVDMGAAMLVEDIQQALIDAGYDLGDWTPVGPGYSPGADGVWGTTSKVKFAEALKNGDVSIPAHSHTFNVSGKTSVV